jgi:predicted GNAT family N-acyltransferase
LGGDGEPGAVHLAALDAAGEVVCACVLYPRTYPHRPEAPDAWQLRGMATAQEVRNQGVGAQVIAEAVTEVRSRGGRLLWCEAREPVIPFYARNGFHGEGEIYIGAETGIPHQFMWRELSE